MKRKIRNGQILFFAIRRSGYNSLVTLLPRASAGGTNYKADDGSIRGAEHIDAMELREWMCATLMSKRPSNMRERA